MSANFHIIHWQDMEMLGERRQNIHCARKVGNVVRVIMS